MRQYDVVIVIEVVQDYLLYKAVVAALAKAP